MDLQPRHRALRTLLGACALLLALVAAPSAHGASAPSITGFGVRPMTPAGATEPPAYFTVDGERGTTSRRSVVVTNESDELLRLRVDGVDGLVSDESGVVYAESASKARKVGRWIRPARKVIHVKPNSTRRLRFRIRIPRGVRGGDHVGGIAFEDLARHTSKGRFAITQITRVVIGVHVILPGGRRAQLAVGKPTIEAQPGTSIGTVRIPLHDTGDRLCKPRIRMRAASVDAGDGAAEPRTVERQLDTLLPRKRINLSVALQGAIAPGRYRVRVRIGGCGPERRVEDVVSVGDELTGTTPEPAAEPVARDGRGIPVAAGFAAAGAFGVAMGIAGMKLTGRRRAA